MISYILIGTLNQRNSLNAASVAANNFQWNCIDSLKIKKVISINPNEFVSENDIVVWSFWTENKLRYLMSSLVRFLKQTKNNRPLFYNIEWYTIHLLIIGIIFRRYPRVIALDLSLNRYVYKCLLLLTKNPIVLRREFLLYKKQKHVLFPGFISQFSTASKTSKSCNSSSRAILCGSLGPNTGLREYCIEAMKYSDMEFHVVGVAHRIKESDIIKIIDYYNSNNNIIYHGQLTWAKYSELLQSCDFGFSLRSSVDENMYNFPSKILEYISAGLIPISSITYPEYLEFKIFGIEDIPSLRITSNLDKEVIIESNQRVLTNYNKVERFF